MAFKYQPRSDADWERRENISNSQFEGFIRDEYRMFIAQKGDNHVRFLPPTWAGARHFGMDIFVHYRVGPSKASVLCNYKMLGTACPICQERCRAEKARDEETVNDLRVVYRVLT